ncbi:tetratricopeptide repeat protein [bacterium]|nr:tetratricopeptide repeat protein [bacterium]
MKARFVWMSIFLTVLFYTGASHLQTLSSVFEPDTTGADTFLKTAHDYYTKSLYDSSEIFYEKALHLYEKTPVSDRDSTCYAGIVFCLNKIGQNLLRQAMYQNAMDYLNRALETGLKHLGEPHPHIADIYENMGSVFRRRQKFDMARDYYYRSYQMNLTLHRSVAMLHNYLGVLFDEIGDFDQSLEHYYKALALFKDEYGETDMNVACIYNNIGMIKQVRCDYDGAFEDYKKALVIFLDRLGEYHVNTANCYFNIGHLFHEKGDLDKTLDYFYKSLRIDLKNLGENHPSVAHTYNSLGVVLMDKGDYDQALEYSMKAVSIISQDSSRRSHRALNYAYANIGNLYAVKKEYEKALEYHQKAQELLPPDHPDAGTGYKEMARIYHEMGDDTEALDYYNKALARLTRTYGDRHKKVAVTYMNMGLLYAQQRQFDKAMSCYQKALSIVMEVFGKKHTLAADIYNRMSELYFSQYQAQEALAAAQNAMISSVRDFNDADPAKNPALDDVLSEIDLFRAIELKTDILRSKYASSHDANELKIAWATSQLGAALIDRMRNSFKHENSKLFIGEKAAFIHDLGVQSAYTLFQQTGDSAFLESAFVFAEKAKSSVLLSLLLDSKARRFSGIPDSLLQMEKQLRVDQACYETHLQSELQNRENQDSLKILNFGNKMFDINRSYQELIERFEQEYPNYYRLKYRTHVPSVKEVQQTLDDNTSLIEYHAGKEFLIIFTITRDTFNVVSTSVDTSFFQMVQGLVQSIKKVDAQHFAAYSHQAYQALIRPVEADIRDNQRLLIIPHGLLYKIPFETLIIEKPENGEQYDFSKYDYLLNHFDICYHYSTTLALEGETRIFEQMAHGQQEPGSFIGFAPVFSDDLNNGTILSGRVPELKLASAEPELRSVVVDGKRFHELRHSENEVRTIVRLFEKKDREALGYFHRKATEENFKSTASRYRIIHIASHGLIREDHPELSGIIFSQPEEPAASEDGILFSGETYNLDLNADLVVLSSCESGMGKLVKGEGLMALTRGFLSSGASNIVVSLWKVDDLSASRFMTEFYQRILDGESYAESLSLVKRSLINNPETAFPKIWSGFVLIGD